ncbi:DUF5709 domain-containing protein [Aestuariimicrobium sp. p3-SID1156]|uniref:DUF5709 domain-containing protein n=1 Tax=Aestuariimicrobium sp. p3-SID1156 TaxID=2916038 RepID=UPI00223B23D9|nr:DUF5709 domain-containing protein [Aestuariimicrobium sp. p3-SID1156]MCT1459262.1 DUF5709 domain-containing protein [Aestuariimicrobium sp. p3-SID1156]
MAPDFEIPDLGSEREVDQLQASDTLVDRGVDDLLDEGIIPPDQYSPLQGFGNTPREMREGETLEMRIKQEQPDRELPDPDADWNPLRERREVGAKRAGRLIGHADGYDSPDHEPESIGRDVGLDGGAACAEEAAMHIIDDTHVDGDDPEY